MAEHRVSRVGLHDCKRAAATLTASFSSDPTTDFYCRSTGKPEPECLQLLEQIMEFAVYVHILDGVVYEIDDFKGVVLWMPPNCHMTLWSKLRAGYLGLWLRLPWITTHRLFTVFFPLLEASMNKTLSAAEFPKTWYLVYVGILPSAQGQGLLRKLVQPVFSEIDKQGLLCYLEATRPETSFLYERLGFKKRDQLSCIDDKYVGHSASGQDTPHLNELSFCIMVREPQG